MAKLMTLKPQLQCIAPRLKSTAATYSPEAQGDWSKLYDLRAWRGKPNGLRWKSLQRDNWTCQICGALIADQSKAHADHIEPHRGNMALFLDPQNVRCLCEHCHNSVKQREERQDQIRRWKE